MKTLLPIILACIALLTGCEPEVKRVEPTPEEKAAIVEKKKEAELSQAGPKRYICPQCKGEKSIMIRSGNSTADFRQSCPVCVGRGYRDMQLAPGKRQCPDCQGMGALLEDAKTSGKSAFGGATQLAGSYAGRIVCARCFGTGGITAPPKTK